MSHHTASEDLYRFLDRLDVCVQQYSGAGAHMCTHSHASLHLLSSAKTLSLYLEAEIELISEQLAAIAAYIALKPAV